MATKKQIAQVANSSGGYKPTMGGSVSQNKANATSNTSFRAVAKSTGASVDNAKRIKQLARELATHSKN